MAEIAIGIDLGTSNSCVAMARGKKVDVLPNGYGERVTASVVAFHDDGSVTVGNTAKANLIHDPHNTVASAKRLIGRYFFSEEVKKAQAIYSYEISEGPGHSLRIQVRDEQFSLPEVSAMVLREMKTVAEERLGHEVRKAVITVPAYFNDNQRQATKDAGRIAGLEVLRLLNEPTAAALAYGFGRGLTQRVAVYDLGGGTFDISILEIGKDVFEVLSTCGDTYLGGDDLDDRLIDMLADEFLSKEGINLRGDPYALEKLKLAAENAKKGLSVEEQVEIRIPDIVQSDDGRPLSIERTVSASEFSSLVMDLIQRTFKVCDEALQQANLVTRDLGGVILVGGPTRLPIVRQAVADYFGQDPKVDVDPDEVVAMGAAIHAASLVSTDSDDAFLLDVTPLSLRIGVAGGLAETVIERNTPVPIEQTRTFTTYQDFQDSVKIRVCQGESRKASENELLGQFEFAGFKKARRGEVKIDVTFEINSDGIVNVTACDQETGQQASTSITLSSGLSEEEIQGIISRGQAERVQTEPVTETSGMKEAERAEAMAPFMDEGAFSPEGQELVPVEEPAPAQAVVAPEPEPVVAAPEPTPPLAPEPEIELGAAPADELLGEADLIPEEAPIALETVQPELAPASAAEVPLEVEQDANARTTPALNGELEIDSGDLGDDLELSPEDLQEIELETGAESLFDQAGADLSELTGDDEEV